MVISILFIIIGFIFLVKGADFLVEGSSYLAKKIHIPEIVIGLTIISIGTSMPELFVSITSALEGYPDMSIGNVVGSNIVNLLFILGASAVLSKIDISRQTKLIEIPICLVVTAVFILICNFGENITRTEGLFLILLFILFIGYTIIITIKSKQNINEDNVLEDTTTIFKDICFIVIGVIALKVGGDIVVTNAVNVANFFKLSEKIIGITILAIGTSLPELVTSVSAALKGKTDIAIGNILGSNIFNMLLIIGVSAVITPISYNISYNKDLIILFISTLLLWLFTVVPPKNQMSKFKGIIYVFIYIEYIYCLLFI